MKMKLHKTKTGKSFALFLIAALFFAAVAPEFTQAQSPRLFGELTVIKNAAMPGAESGSVTVDGVRAESGRSVMSPSDIQTPPDAAAKISFAQTGTLNIAPSSSMNVTFVNSSIAGDLANGEITVETVPNTTINIFTKDGAIWTPNRNEKNTVKISVQNGATRVNVIDGQIMFNKVIVSAGETYPKSSNGSSPNSSRGINPLIIAGIVGGIAAAVIIALTVSGGNNNDVPVFSPTR